MTGEGDGLPGPLRCQTAKRTNQSKWDKTELNRLQIRLGQSLNTAVVPRLVPKPFPYGEG